MTAVIDRLDVTARLGFKAIHFLPWTAWGDESVNWGYAPFQHFAVDPRLANGWGQPAEKLTQLIALVNACHTRGIHVIMDGVFNNVTPRFPYPQFYSDPSRCPHSGQFGGEFANLPDTNFANACTRELILDACPY